MNRIEKKFKELKEKNKKALIVFITAGYPNLNITRKLIFEFSRIGVDIVELGVPFSDPIADGPIIQEASNLSLKKKVNLARILNLVRSVRRDTDMPICLMSYFNPIFCLGERKFIKTAKKCGVDGVIIPDLPPEENPEFTRDAKKSGLDTIFFISPTTAAKRVKLVSNNSRGFIYYVSLTGVTGPRKNLPADLKNNLNMIKKFTAKPVCVGFGVSSPRQVKQISRIADGVIVGSAVVKKIKENLGKAGLVKKVGNFVKNLKGA